MYAGEAEVFQRQFTIDDQLKFAELSGDRNPMHIDPLKSRRLMFGAPVVHGANLVLWTLECFVDSPQLVKAVNAKFNHAVRVGQIVGLKQLNASAEKTRIVVLADGIAATTIDIFFGDCFVGAAQKIQTSNSIAVPKKVTRNEIVGASGSIPMSVAEATARECYPKTWAMAPDLVGAIAASSYLVGMECPGEDSIFSTLSLTRRNNCAAPDGSMDWRVSSFDDRFSRLCILAESCDAEINIVAFMRPQPKAQPTFDELRKLVLQGEFSDRRAVVVGGSRGLGEFCSKLLAAGGAQVCITYQRGQEEAESVVKEIRAAGGNAAAQQHDALLPPSHEYREFASALNATHLLYFATPAIFVGTRKFSNELFQRFCDYYITGLVDTIAVTRGKGPLRACLCCSLR